jgi:hypothetical protein
MVAEVISGAIAATVITLAWRDKYTLATEGATAVLRLWVGVLSRPSNAEETTAHATRYNPGEAISDVITNSAAAASLGG